LQHAQEFTLQISNRRPRWRCPPASRPGPR
jgi:hypothetical protein